MYCCKSFLKLLSRSTVMSLITLSGSIVLAQSPTKPTPDKPKDWRIVAKEDIAAAYQSTLDNHPGMLDPLNPKFGETLEAARRAALRLAGQYDSAASYRAAIALFRAQLNDGHAGAYSRVPPEWLPAVRWPGFVTTWRTNGLFVSRSDDKRIAVGAHVTVCDGQPIEALIKTNVFGFRVGVNQPGQWWTDASRVFFDDGNPFVRVPLRCEFELLDKKQVLELSWQEAPSEIDTWRKASIASGRFSTQIQELAPGVAWISMPTFSPDPEQVKDLEKLYKTVAAKKSVLTSAKALVIDLRGNQGGSSNWSLQLARVLWGTKAVDAHWDYANRKVQILWRPTEGNETAMRNYLPLLQKQGQTEQAGEIKKMADQMNKARASNLSLMPERVSNKSDNAKKPS
jgi:Peptidase family S41